MRARILFITKKWGLFVVRGGVAGVRFVPDALQRGLSYLVLKWAKLKLERGNWAEGPKTKEEIEIGDWPIKAKVSDSPVAIRDKGEQPRSRPGLPRNAE